MISLSRFSVFSWFSIRKFYVSRDLLIFSRLSNLLAYSCSLYYLINILYLCDISCYFSSFIFCFIYSVLLFLLLSLAIGYQVYFFKNTSSWFHWFFVLLFWEGSLFCLLFYFIYSDLYYFLSPNDFHGFGSFSNSFRQ